MKFLGIFLILFIGMETQFTVVSNTRKFVHEGIMNRLDEETEYYWFLFNDLLVWTKPKKNQYQYKALTYLTAINIDQIDQSKKFL